MNSHITWHLIVSNKLLLGKPLKYLKLRRANLANVFAAHCVLETKWGKIIITD